MKIAIDLNDVVRDFSNNFLKYYIERYNHEFDLEDFEFWSNKLCDVFQFNSENAYNNFVYNDYAFELFGKPSVCYRGLEKDLNNFTEKTIKDIDCDEELDIMFVSTMEYGLSIGNTYFFISKLGTKIREIYLPKDSTTIWDKCDILITANPNLLEIKPDGKISIKINFDYNKEYESDYNFNNLGQFLNNVELIKKLLTNEKQ